MHGKGWLQRATSAVLGKPVAVLERPGLFHFSVPVDIELSCGAYVTLSSRDHTFLGQVDTTSLNFLYDVRTMGVSFASVLRTTLEMTGVAPRGYYAGQGRILAYVDDSRVRLDFDTYRCSGNASVKLAPDELVRSYFKVAYSGETTLLPVGTLLNVREPVRVNLIPDGLKRPTGVFGQSGSGKSFALAILLEELHLKTRTNIIVLDPNGDFSRFTEPLRMIDEINHERNKYVFRQEEIDRYIQLHDAKRESVRILSGERSADAEQIVVRLSDLDARWQALLLDLDPTRDTTEYHHLSTIVADLCDGNPQYGIKDLIGYCRSKPLRVYGNLLARIENLGLENLRIWGDESHRNGMPLTDVLSQSDLQTVIIDLSTLSRLERVIVSTVVFRQLWDIQADRKGNNATKASLLFVDEAHNLFPAKPLLPEQTLALDWGSRIAGEGRKFGLYLIVSSQLPSKIHQHVLTQCGNVVLMKMMSQSDIDALRDSFSFVSDMLLYMSRSFRTGEALVIGGIVPGPCLVRFEGRKTREGGQDLKVRWNSKK